VGCFVCGSQTKTGYYEKWNRWGKMPHFSQNRKFLQILFLRKLFICVS